MRNSSGNRLEGRPSDAGALRNLILAGGEVRRFYDPARPFLHPEEVEIALDIDRFDFALRVESRTGDRLRILKSSPDAEGRRRTFLGASFIGDRLWLRASGAITVGFQPVRRPKSL
jgi:hypothetical protein